MLGHRKYVVIQEVPNLIRAAKNPLKVQQNLLVGVCISVFLVQKSRSSNFMLCLLSPESTKMG